MRRARGLRGGAGLLAAAFAAACCGGPKAPVGPGGGEGSGSGSGSAWEDATGLEPDEPEVPLEERIAAIEHAMNDLAPVANQCWAAAAADDLHVAGAVRMLVSVARDGHARAEASLDEPDDPVLTRCLAEVLGAYEWAPPIRGQTVELPFEFTAPAMQNVIDRRMVPHKAQAGVDVAVLIDLVNTANPAASLLDVTIAPDAKSGPRQVERTELWLFHSGARVTWAGGPDTPVPLVVGSALWVPAGARLLVMPPEPVGHLAQPTPVRALVAIVPGGREGAARAGALPGASTSLPEGTSAYPRAVVVPVSGATTYPRPGGQATIRVEPKVPAPTVGNQLSMIGLRLDAGAVVPPHVHAAETELLYLNGGSGTMTIGGVDVAVSEHSVIQIPAGVEHSFTAAAEVHAMQFYTPAGPEQRFKKKP